MKVTDKYASPGVRPLIAYDFSPPRHGDPAFAKQAASWDVDFICVAYSPGKSVRMESMVAAALLKRLAGKEVVFNVATRDMNRLALQSHLLGAQALGLENVLVVKGDDFTEHELERVKPVGDYRPTELMRAIKAMDQGLDFKGLKLRAPTAFCVGAIVDLGRDLGRETQLAHLKVQAGAGFLITQAVYDIAAVQEFQERYASLAGQPISVPVFYGVQVLIKDGITFGEPPPHIQRDLAKGRSGVDIAVELATALTAASCDALYLVPPILKGGVRNNAAAQQVLAAIRTGR